MSQSSVGRRTGSALNLRSAPVETYDLRRGSHQTKDLLIQRMGRVEEASPVHSADHVM